MNANQGSSDHFSPTPLPIERVAENLGVSADRVERYGTHKAKLGGAAPADVDCRGKLVLVSGMTPSGRGVGKTLTTIGLGQAFGKLGLSNCVCLRQPSLGRRSG